MIEAFATAAVARVRPAKLYSGDDEAKKSKESVPLLLAARASTASRKDREQ